MIYSRLMSDDDAMLQLQGLVPGLLAACLRQSDQTPPAGDLEAVAMAMERGRDADILLEEMFDFGFSEEDVCLAIARVSAAIIEILAKADNLDAVELLAEFSLRHAGHTPWTDTGDSEDS